MSRKLPQLLGGALHFGCLLSIVLLIPRSVFLVDLSVFGRPRPFARAARGDRFSRRSPLASSGGGSSKKAGTGASVTMATADETEMETFRVTSVDGGDGVPSEEFKPLKAGQQVTATQSASESVSQLPPGGRLARWSSTAAAPLSNRQVPADRGSFSLVAPAHPDGWSTDDSDSESDALVGSKKRPDADLHRRYHLSLIHIFVSFISLLWAIHRVPSSRLGGRGGAFL